MEGSKLFFVLLFDFLLPRFIHDALFSLVPFEEVPEGVVIVRVEELVYSKGGWRGRFLGTPSALVDMEEAEKSTILSAI